MKPKNPPLLYIVSLALISGQSLFGQQDPKWTTRLDQAGANADEITAFVQTATEEFGAEGKGAAEFLVSFMPAQDLENLSSEFLLENTRLAFRARKEFSWCSELPTERFLNDVLPYACIDERRDPWRAEFYPQVATLVSKATSAAEAAQILNRDFFNLINVHYNTGRKRPNQSPRESIEQGRATCTGLSIILVDACRAAGVPARIAGTPMWTNKRGNHTWVEIWDGDWHFAGADEYDAKGLDRGWFVGDASKAKADIPEHAIYASSWRDTGIIFPLAWNRRQQTVFAENVTVRYAKTESSSIPEEARLFLRVFDQNGTRIVVTTDLLDESGKVLKTQKTNAGQSDLNDMPSFNCAAGQCLWLKMTHTDAAKGVPIVRSSPGPVTLSLNWEDLPLWHEDTPTPSLTAIKAWLNLPTAVRTTDFPADWNVETLSKTDAVDVKSLLWENLKTVLAEERKAELEQKTLILEDKSMRLLDRTFGDAPETGRSLWISMHGGGGAPARVNDQQWQNQIKLYEPPEGIVVAPRAPTDNWNLWHESHIDPMFDRLIEDYVILRGVNPDKVYLMGYSAGGDGVYQLAPRMADRFAAASMMAGHPNDASPLGLRNLPFAIFVGGKDGAYNRNKVAAEWASKLDALEETEPGGYLHRLNIYPECGHWMNLQDKEALPWMFQFDRNPWPQKIVWHQGNVPHNRFYWLSVPVSEATKGTTINAEVSGQKITIKGNVSTIVLRLSDQLLDLDQPIEVQWNGKSLFQGEVKRTIRAISQSLRERADDKSVATALLQLTQ